MANKASSRHMGGLASPTFIAIERKHYKYIMKPMPGRHSLQRCISLGLTLKKLGLAKTSGEYKDIIRKGSVLVNGNVIRDAAYPVGLNDIVEIKGGKAYFIKINKYSKVEFEEVKPNYDAMLFKVIGKYKAAKNQIMVRLHDGSTIKSKNDIKVNDSILIDSKHAIKKVIPMKVGATCVVIDGVHVGTSGKVSSIKEGTEKGVSSAVVKSNTEEFETLTKNIMVTA
ncbi:MAG: RNA-binding S4 domain-containing protein [Candidatus Marsarchaeota archaeon]|nr:RNA-binding S4 domain-containing protein [Candidatus Marsarchaeota archaeon]